MRVLIATPTVDGRVCDRTQVASLQVFQDLILAGSPHAFVGIQHSRGHLVTNRNVLLCQALAAPLVDVMFWMDADCAPLYEKPEHLWNWIGLAQGNVAMAGVRCARRGGGWNVQPLREATSPRETWAPYEVRSVGLGLCLYNMRWWRRALAERPPVDGALHFFEWRDGVTEDYRACEWARDNGGAIMVEPAIGSWHDGMTVEPQVGRIARPS